MPGAGLFGRDEQLAALHAAVARARTGAAQLVTIRGEAGIGKSALLDAATDTLAVSGTTVVRIALSSVESQLGWAGLRLICDQIDRALDEVPEPSRPAIAAAIGRAATTDVDPSQVAFGLADLLGAAADAMPLVLVVDDLHWLDGATAAALAFAIRSTARRPLLTVLAHRPVQLPLDPTRLLDASCRTTIELDGLSIASVHRVLRERAGVRLGRPDAIRIHAVTGGNPLHTLEIGRLVAGGVTLDDALVHPSAHDLVLARIRPMSADARQVLLAAALAVRPTLDRVSAALPGVDVERALDDVADEGLADLRAGRIEFLHPLVRAAIVAEASGATRRKVQRALADTTEDPDERVLLREAAADGPDAALAAELEAASSRAAERGDLVLAARLARSAAERTPGDDVDARVARLLDAADLAAASGDHQVPVELADAAVALSDDLDVLFRAGVTKALTIGNRGEEAATLALLEELLVPLAGRPAQSARLHDIRAQALMRTDVGGSLEAALASLAEATAAGDAAGIDRARSLADFVSVLSGAPVDLDDVEARCDRLPLTSVARDWCVSALGAAQLASRSLRHNVLQLAEYQRLGLVHYEAPTRSRMLADLIALGRYREALDQAQACLDLHEMIGGLHQSAIHADLAFLTTVLCDDSQASGAQATEVLATATRSVLASDDNIDTVGAMARLAQVAVLRGAWAEAADWAERAGAVAHRVGLGASDVFAHRIDGAEALIQLGRVDEAERLLGELEAVNATSGLLRGAADSVRGRALVASARGELDTALELGTAAGDGYRAIELPLETGRALQLVGVTLRRAGKRADAAEALGQARQLFERIEAPSLVARADAEIERLGAKRSAGTTTLTPTEQQVADLVVAGKSNAEIAATLVVSLRTVESNLTRAYRKLGVRSRTELAALLRDR